MKKIVLILLCITMLFSSVNVFAIDTIETTNKQYELWTQSPEITSGLTTAEMRVYKAMETGKLELYPLPQLGSNYFLSIIQSQYTDGGYSGKTKTSYYYYNIIKTTGQRFIVLNNVETYNEYYWDRGHCVLDLTSLIDASRYRSLGYEVPILMLNPSGKYTNSNYDEEDEYFIVTDAGNIYRISEDADYGAERYPVIKDRKFNLVGTKYRRSSSTYNYTTTNEAGNSVNAAKVEEIVFKNGSFSTYTSQTIPAADLTAANGYASYPEGFASNTRIPNYYKIENSNRLYFSPQITGERNNYTVALNVYQSNGDQMNYYSGISYASTGYYSPTLYVYNIKNIKASEYTSRGYAVPSNIIGTSYVVMSDGSINAIQLDTTIYNSSYTYFCTYNGRLAVIRSRDGTSTIYHQDENGYSSYWYKVNYMYFDKSGRMILSDDMEFKCSSTQPEGLSGYFTSYSNYVESKDIVEATYSSPKEWWDHTLTNVFPDGRYVQCSWQGTGSSCYEIWYEIYSPDGEMIATGPTGYEGSFGSVFDTYDFLCYAINNTKFVVCFTKISNSFLLEYFRIATAYETDEGEIKSGGGSLGEKNLTPPDTADTEPIQPVIDFSQDDLPIGYNIKENVIGTDNFEAELRNQVNAVKLNDIVIVKKEGYVSGVQNTGSTLSYFSTYNYSAGDSIRFYSNGQNVNWYCYYPEDLNEGVYNLTFTSGEKKIYVTVRVIEAPSSDGSTTVVF